MAKKALGRGLGAIFGGEDISSAREQEKNKAASGGSGEPVKKQSKPGRKTEAAEQTEKASEKEKKQPKRKEKTSPAEKAGSESERRYVRTSLVEPNRSQPRKNFDEESLRELSDSIKRFGILQPLIVRKTGITYTIVAGERRWRAAKLAGLKEVPVIVTDLDKEDAAEIALIENLQREDLGPVEEALAFRELMDGYGLTQEEVAEKVSKSRASIANSLRLLQLPGEVLELLTEGRISAGHARCLITIEDEKELKALATEIAEKGLSVREAEKRAAALKKKTGSGPVKKKEDPEAERREIFLKDLELRLCEGLNTKVHIRAGRKEQGRIEIEYYSLDELNRISDLLR